MNTHPKGLHSRGYLPHVDGAEYQMITYRLGDALPQNVLERLKELPEKQRRIQTEAIMDSGLGSCLLAKPEIASMVIDNWRYFDNNRYQLIAWVIMPNHVHVLIRVFENQSLSNIVQSWKSYTSKQILKHLHHAGGPPALPEKAIATDAESETRQIWQADYWDRYIRDEKHYRQAIEYIHQNPVKAGLVNHPEEWHWSSAS